MSQKFGLLPSRSQPDHKPEPVVIPLSDSDTLLDALGSRTAREILAIISEEPASVSDIAESADTSIQNAGYHVRNLQNAGLVEVVDTWYSSKGVEMTVYATAYQPLVISLGGEADESLPDEIETSEPWSAASIAWD